MKPPILCTLILVAAMSTHADTAPRLLPFQGRLTDQSGMAVSNGVRLVQFKIYDVPTSGSPVWAGELHRTTINGGLVNVMLGSKTPLSGVDFDKQLYLEITVDVSGPTGQPDNSITAADPPMLPRQAILPVVFAKEAADSRLLDGYDWKPIFGTNDPTIPIPASKLADGSLPGGKIAAKSIADAQLAAGIAVPVGAVVMWWGTTSAIPANFELCDGTAPSTAGATLAGNKPDLQDRFVKGALSGATDVKTSPIVGGTHFLNLEHNHYMDHTHGSDGLWVPISGGPRNAIWFGEIGGGSGYARGTVGPGYGLVIGPTRGTFGEEQQNVKPGTAVFGATANASRAMTDIESPRLTNTDNRPAFLEMFFIIRVK